MTLLRHRPADDKEARGRRAAMALATIAMATTLLAGCSATGGTGAGATPSALESLSSSPAASTPGDTATGSPGPVGGATPQVGLTFTGTVKLVANGAAGQCQLGKGSDGSVKA
ncbi:MAG: hypothetical protein ABIV26_01060, partial [Candidatus Limnocylindrales bacterium]